MPISKTAKRALRSSKKKFEVNNEVRTNLEIAIRKAKKTGSAKDIRNAISATDRAAKKGIIHKNKAARIKSKLAKLSKHKVARKPKGK